MTKKIASDIQMWDISRPRPYDKNAKVHDEAQVAKIATSIDKFGWRGNPIVVDENGVILAGHGRRLAALKLGLKQVPVLQMTDMSEDEKRAFRLADNRVAIGNIDADLLAKEIAEMEFDLSGMFDAKELQFVSADIGVLNEDAFVPDLDAELDAQSAETKDTIAAAATRPVAIAKALGFKSVAGADEREIAMFMAQLEADSGKSGADAFMEFVRTMNKSQVK
jgi:ParB-like chromosome segregation protein Spo0J